MKKTHRIATIPGHGIGKDVVPAGWQLIEARATADPSLSFEFEDVHWAGDYYRAHGRTMPADRLDRLRSKEALLFGSAGAPHILDHVTLFEEATDVTIVTRADVERTSSGSSAMRAASRSRGCASRSRSSASRTRSATRW